ncbi:MAG TPA: hypothetical protein VMZ51_06750 [Acidimicrobiales bacterium]|nr:hypothetical protein [Acidimicrobiales bacterium]
MLHQHSSGGLISRSASSESYRDHILPGKDVGIKGATESDVFTGDE